MLPLWAFAQAIYRSPGFAEAALRLQDEHDADVCVLIWLIWHLRQRNGVDAATLGAILAAIQPWRAGVIEPLRAARRAMKPLLEATPLRTQVQALELEAEQRHLARLDTITLSGPPCDNLAVYATLLDTTFPPDDVAILLAATA